MTSEDAYLDSAINRYAPAVAATARAGLRKLRGRFPGARVSVYDRRQSLAIGFAPDAGGAAIFSLVLYPRWVRFFFLTGVELDDPEGRLEGDGSQVRSIRVDSAAPVLDDRYIRALMTQALQLSGADLKNGSGRIELRTTLKTAKSMAAPKAPLKRAARAEAKPATKDRPRLVRLLSGGNPQVAKADGEAPVRAYIAAIPGWKRDVARRLDALVVREVPQVTKAVKWNSPFYGIDGQGWFLSFHVFNKYVKVTFFKGTSLTPVPAGGTAKEGRWIDVHEDDLDEAQLVAWIRQAAALPGWGGK